MNPRVILITGANGDLGQAIAEGFLAESSRNRVWLGVRRNRERAERCAQSHADRCRCVELDVTQPAAWGAAVEQILAKHGRLDVLVNNAGGHQDMLLGAMPKAAWEEVRSTNLDGVFHGCQAVLPAMISQKEGRIINISSLSALLAPAGQANYAAAKAGVVALTQSLAKEVARLNITVNVVCPGYLDTELTRRMSAEEQAAARAKVPMRRFGKPAEVAALVEFLACPAAGYITGSVVKIDGGIL